MAADAVVAGTSMEVFRELPGWGSAVGALNDLHDRTGDRAALAADRFATRFQGQRAAMVFDVVFSANRTYESRVARRVEEFQRTEAAASLRALAEQGVRDTKGFRRFEADSMRSLANSFADYAEVHGLDDDAACYRWATTADPGVVFGLDPVIGRVKGVALALYRYLRMRCGADDLKPDRRVAASLERLGFPAVAGSEAIYALAMAVSRDSGISPLVLDQLLWLET